MKVQESKEMYLETILILTNRNGHVRSIDIANEMSFSKPSVSRAVGILKKEGLIDVDNHGFITLSKEGAILAESVLARHKALKKLLMYLGVEESVADDDACRIEHVISSKSFEAIQRFVSDKEIKE